jgi:hypothetical protein
MNYAWMCPVPLEKAITADPGMSGMFSAAGDSMVFVNKYGRRVVNEKLQYNELAQAFFRWDPAAAEYPNLVLAQVWDQRSQDHSASTEYGRLIMPPGTDDSHVVKGETLEELTRGIDERLARYASRTGGLRLAPEFLANLTGTLRRFNAMAREGVDRDFHHGERAVQLLFNGLVKDEPGRANPTLWPLSDIGPYYAGLGFPARNDIPFQDALADACTVGDVYHCPALSATGPNRTCLRGGTINADQEHGSCVACDGGDEPGKFLPWQSHPAALQNAGVTWKICQGSDNYGDNGAQYCKTFAEPDPSQGGTAAPGNPCYGNGLTTVPEPLDPGLFDADNLASAIKMAGAPGARSQA